MVRRIDNRGYEARENKPSRDMAMRVARDWSGGDKASAMWSFSENGVVWSEDHRRRILEEAGLMLLWLEDYSKKRMALPMRERGPDQFHREPHRLRRLVEYVTNVRSRK